MAAEQPKMRLQVVGIDGSSGSARALQWALARAERLGPVEPVIAWRYPWWALVPTATGTLLPPNHEDFDAIATRMASKMLDRADVERYRDPVVIHGAAGPALVAAADRASLLVVGTRGRSSLTGGLLGSVSLHCVHHATVPVAVVPPDASIDDHFDRVVVGIDGSKHGAAALEWAIDNTPPGSQIDVIHAWHSETTVAEVAALAAERIEALSHQLVVDAIDEVRDRIEETGRHLSGRSRRGDPRRVLHSQSEQADLLVVGARGHEGLAHLLLGSVAGSLVHQPATTTVVVR